MVGAGAPRYRGAALHRVWWRALTPADKLRSFLGTLKRLLVRGVLRDERAQFVDAPQR